MPDPIILRLHPVEPTDGLTFTSYLTGFTITAFDLSYGDSSVGGVQIGQASGAWIPPSDNPLNPGLHDFSPATPKVFQHFSIVTVNPSGPVQVVKLEAVATAVIVVNPPAGHPEYQGSDLRLEITNNGRSNKRRLRDGKLHADMPYWGNLPVPRGWHTTEEPCDPDDDCCCPRSPYRFLFLVQKAQETAADVRALGAELLAAFEKGDAEYLAGLRAAHERQLLNLTREIRQNEWRDADWQVQGLKKTKEGAQARRQYYANLIANSLLGNEQDYKNLTVVSMITRAAGNVVEAVGQVMNLNPDPTVGSRALPPPRCQSLRNRSIAWTKPSSWATTRSASVGASLCLRSHARQTKVCPSVLMPGCLPRRSVDSTINPSFPRGEMSWNFSK